MVQLGNFQEPVSITLVSGIINVQFSDITRFHLSKFMPKIVLERKNKAEFSTMFRSYLDHMEELFIEEIPERRNNWVTYEGMKKLFEEYRGNPQAGWPMWVLWSIFGCDSIR